MTLPTGSLSADQIVTELRVANPGRARLMGLQDADVRTLAGVASGPISFNDLRGKTSYTPMSGSVPNVNDTDTINTAANHTHSTGIAVSRAGGIAPYSYAWTKLSGAGTVNAANSASTTADFVVSRFAVPGDTMQLVAQCVVTDSTGATLTRSGTITLTLG